MTDSKEKTPHLAVRSRFLADVARKKRCAHGDALPRRPHEWRSNSDELQPVPVVRPWTVVTRRRVQRTRRRLFLLSLVPTCSAGFRRPGDSMSPLYATAFAFAAWALSWLAAAFWSDPA